MGFLDGIVGSCRVQELIQRLLILSERQSNLDQTVLSVFSIIRLTALHSGINSLLQLCVILTIALCTTWGYKLRSNRTLVLMLWKTVLMPLCHLPSRKKKTMKKEKKNANKGKEKLSKTSNYNLEERKTNDQ